MKRVERVMNDVMVPGSGWLTPQAIKDAIGNAWNAHEERDIDRPAQAPARARVRAVQARRTLDTSAALRLLRDAPRVERRSLIALLLAPGLDLSTPKAWRFATTVFDTVATDELTAASLVRAVEAAARAGREDLVARSRESSRATFEKAASLLQLVADRLERAGDLDAARRLRTTHWRSLS